MNDIEYDRMYAAEESHWWYVALHDLILARVAREHAEKGPLRILDAGCGTGRLCQLLAPFGTTTGCDLSPRALDFCRTRGLAHVFLADLGNADLGENRYDVITAIDVLYHRAVSSEEEVIARFHRALRPGGLLIVNLVAHEFLRSTHDIAVHTRKRYVRRDILPLLERSGFRVERSSYRLGFLFLPIALYRFSKRLLPHPREAVRVDSDVRLPHPLVNRFLRRIAIAENRRIERRPVPLGTSLFITARKERGLGNEPAHSG